MRIIYILDNLSCNRQDAYRCVYPKCVKGPNPQDMCMTRVSAGYMCCPFVLDKDGVSAAVITAELASFLATKNLSLSQQLKAIYVE